MIWQKLSHGLLGGHCLREVFQTLRGCNLAQDLVIHTSFDDLDHISSSQVCQNCKLKIVLRFLSTVVYWCMVATHIRKIKSSKPFVTGVYLRAATNTSLCVSQSYPSPVQQNFHSDEVDCHAIGEKDTVGKCML